MATLETRAELITIVVAMFDAAPGVAVLSDLVAASDAGNSNTAIAVSLANSAEFKSIFPTFQTNAEFVSKFVDQMVGNLVVESQKDDVKNILTAELNNGASKVDVVLTAVAALKAIPESDSVWGNAAAAFNNKVEVATYHTVQQQQATTTLNGLQSILASVDNTEASVTAAKTSVDNVSNPGQVYTATAGVDTFTGTAGDDTFNANSTSATTPATTFTALDSYTGGAGKDTLNIVDVNALTLPTTAKVSGIEVANISSNGALNGSVAGWTGLETLTAAAVGGSTAQTLTAGSSTVTFSNSATLTGTGTSGAITVNGGKTVDVTNSLAQNTAAATTTGGTVTVNGTSATDSVKVSQTATSASVAQVTESASVVMDAGGMVNGNTYTIAGLTLTATGAIAAADIAAGFASLTAGATAGNAVVNGTWSGTLTGYNTGAAAGSTVVFTSTTANTNVSDLSPSATGATAAVATITQGNAGKAGITSGDVAITDTNSSSTTTAGVIKSVELSNFGTATVNSGALETVTLSGKGTAFDASTSGALATGAVSTLTLNLNGLTTTGAITFDSDIKTLNVKASGASNSTAATLSASGATAINVSGDKTFTASAATLNAAAVITSTNTAGVTFTSALGTGVTFTGGAGKDTVTVGATTKAITGGAGDDTVTINGGVVGTGGSVTGGDGRDTLSLTQADAATVSASAAVTNFTGKVTGFEILKVAATTAGSTINAANINTSSNNAIDTVAFSGAVGHATTVDGLASGNTVTFAGTNTQATTVNIVNANTSTTDVLNIGLAASGVVAANTINAADIETINFSTTQVTTSAPTGVVHTATLAAAAVKSITVSGNAGLNLTNTNTTVTSFDASGVTKGAVTWTTGNLAAASTVKGGAEANTFDFSAILSTKAVTYTGGAGVDTITFAAGNTADNSITTGAGNDVVTLGGGKNTVDLGAGNDTITLGANLNVVTLGAGNDTVNAAKTTNGNTYSTLTDFAKGDSISFVAASDATIANATLGAAVTLGSTAAFADFLNAATAGDGSGAGLVKWFQYSGDTYVVLDNEADTTYQNGEDTIIKLTGAVDLSTATLATEVLTLA